MSPLTCSIIVFLVLPTLMNNYFSEGAMEDGALERYHVHVRNAFHVSPKMLSVHCKSGDDDLGDHQLKPDEEFSWTFLVNVFESTLYWCNARTQDNLHVSFSSFNETTAIESCPDHDCLWNAKEDGIYTFYNGTEVRWYAWINP